MVEGDLENRFDYHPPKDETVAATHAEVRQVLYIAACEIDRLVPDGREKSLAITNLEQAMFWANGAIARAPENVT